MNGFKKNFAARLTALLLFFVMIAAIILYNAGVYDISFIKRPTKLPSDTEWVTEGDGTESGESTLPPSYTETFEDETGVSDEDAEKLLELIISLNEMKKDGWRVSPSVFGADSSIARLDFDFGSMKNTMTARKETVQRNILYQNSDGSYTVKKVSERIDAPAVRLYFGLVFFDDGSRVSVYNPDGEVIIEDFEGALVYAKTNDGLPVVKISGKYYAIDRDEGLSDRISEEDISFLAISYDCPEYYASSGSVRLYPFSEYVTEYIEITTETEDTEPPTTSKDETTLPDTAVPDKTDTVTPEGTQTSPPDTVTDTGTEKPDETTSGETVGDSSETGAVSTDTETESQTETVPDTSAETSAEITSDGTTAETASDGTAPLDTLASEVNYAAGNTEGTASVKDETTAADTVTDTETAASTETAVGNDTTAADTAQSDTAAPETTAPSDTDADPDEIIDLGDGTYMVGGKLCHKSTLLKWGYRDARGNTVIAPRFKMAYTFSEEGLAATLDFSDRISFIDKKGNVKISLVDNETIKHPEQSRVTVKQQFLQPINNDISALGAYYFDCGYVMVRFTYRNKKDGKLIHNENRLVSSSGKYFDIPAGYVLVNYSDGIMMLEKNGRYGYMDLEGGWCAPPVYSKASPYIQGLAAVGTPDGKMGLIDTEGNYVLPLCFEYVSDVSSGYVAAYSELRGWEIYCVTEK